MVENIWNLGRYFLMCEKKLPVNHKKSKKYSTLDNLL